MFGLFRLAVLIGLVLSITGLAMAEEEIRNYDVLIEVEEDGDLLITETLDVNVEGQEIRRGIFRDLPAYYLDEDETRRLPYRYKVLSVSKDGRREPYQRERIGNAVRVRIGNPDVWLDYRVHRYVIRYRVKNGVRYADGFDEVYWNAIGTSWLFPINEASIEVRFPDDAHLIEAFAYTGRAGAAGNNYTYQAEGASHVFRTNQRLAIREGVTVSLSIEKGAIDPPSAYDKGWLWWARNGALTALITSFFGLFIFYRRSFDRVGRDPVKGPVFPQYEPPKGYSPAAAHHIYYRGFRGHDGLIASLMFLAGAGHMRIDVDRNDKKKTTLSREAAGTSSGLTGELSSFYTQLFSGDETVKLGDKYNAGFTKAYTKFRKRISSKYGAPYFQWNLGYLIFGALLSIGAIVFAITQATSWSLWHTLLVLALVGLNGLFMYLMPAPTPKGQEVRTHLQGFRLYMEKAEKLQLNSVEVGSDAPPPMTVERYETFLPYAVALGVEKPWTKHFERLIPEAAKDYDPAWTNMSARTFGSIGGMTDSMVSGMSTGVTTALPQSSSSSGSGGGGFSGGGGGGGGGGGW
ncbi:MAG: DUF2207 domain-containing protein [Hyphomonadaceae bacterium]|nr:DUF2207 domain-containing protein [Hyphomonadaceae bacterium]